MSEQGLMNFTSVAQNTAANSRTQHDNQRRTAQASAAPTLSPANTRKKSSRWTNKGKLTSEVACFPCFKRNHAASDCRGNIEYTTRNLV